MPETTIGFVPDVGGTLLLVPLAGGDRHARGPDRAPT